MSLLMISIWSFSGSQSKSIFPLPFLVRTSIGYSHPPVSSDLCGVLIDKPHYLWYLMVKRKLAPTRHESLLTSKHIIPLFVGIVNILPTL